MNLPSIKTLERAFPTKGKALRQLLVSAEAVRQHPAAIELERRCYGRPTLSHLRMVALDAEAGTYGVEFAKGTGARNSQSFEYLNTGDSYGTTLIRFVNGRYIVSSWGDIVERGNYS